MRVLLRLLAVENHHEREVRLGSGHEVRALDLVVVKVRNLVESVELVGTVAHDHDDVGPVVQRPLAARDGHHSRELVHAFGSLSVRVWMVVAVTLEALHASVVEH